MKIKTVFIAAMLAVSGFTQAQQVSKEVFEKAVNFLNCKTVELSLKEDTPNFQKYRKKCPCNESGYARVKFFLDSVGKYSATIALLDEIESLKKSFKKDWKQDEVVTLLCETIFTDNTKYQKLFAFADKRKNNPAFETLKRELKAELKKIFDEQVKVSIIEIKEKLKALEEKPPKVEEKGWFNEFTFHIDVFSILIAVILASIIVCGGLYFSKEIKKVSKEVSDKINDLQGKISKNPDGSSSEINNLKKELEGQFKEEISSLRDEIVKKSSQAAKPKYEQPEVKTEIFFLSTPNSDGSFNVSSVSLAYKEGTSIYKFTKVGNNRAEFRIDDKEASVEFALTYPDKNIDPVCEALNAVNSTAKQITTVEPGKAELVNDKWVVNKNHKAKIRYGI